MSEMSLMLRTRDATRLPIEADGLLPDRLANLSAIEVSRLNLPVGNTSAPLGDPFRAEGKAGNGAIIFEGDRRPVRGIGRGLGSGTIIVRGDAGAELGAGMTGGAILAYGIA